MSDAAGLEPITITMTRYREPDWLVREALDSLVRQTGVSGQVIFLDQNWREDFACDVEALSGDALRFRCLPCEERGIAYARMRGFELAETDIILQIDPDVIAEPDWASHLVAALSEKETAIAGSRILPYWRGRPLLLAKSRVVRDQYSILDLGQDTRDVPKIIAAGYGVRKSAAPQHMYFDQSFGRVGGVLFGGEETDLCKRVCADGGRVVYCGKAIVHHQILPERLKWSWIMKRLFFAGAGRRQQGGAPAPSQKPGLWDWVLLPFILPPYALGYCCATVAKR